MSLKKRLLRVGFTMSVVGSVGVKVLRLMILLACLGWGASGFGPIQAFAQDAGVADPAPVEDPPALGCLLYTSPSPRDATLSRMPSSS